MIRLCTALSLVFAAGAIPLAAQKQISDGRRVGADAQIRVWNPAGSVRLTGWDRDSIAVTGSAERGAGRLVLVASESGAKVGFDGDGRADVEIRVPRGSTVWVKTASAGLRVGGLTGAMDLSTVTGAIRVEGTARQITAESIGGDVELTALATTIRAKTGSGSITLRGSGNDVTVATVDGTIRVSGPRFQRARFETISGRIFFQGGVVRDASVTFQSHDGPIEVQLPPKTGATFRISSYDGLVDSSFPAFRAQKRRLRGKEIEFVNGGGGADIAIRTYQGPVTLKAPPSDVRSREKPRGAVVASPK